VSWLLYGASGFTGALVAERARALGMTPILAGRDDAKIAPLAERLGFARRAFPLSDAAAVDRGLDGVTLVLHCAGPFSRTAAPMLDGCVRARAHYLDITGELAVFERHFRRDAELRAAGIVAMSGVGFDVVPTDCMAAALHRALPGATSLELAFGGFGMASRGTATTAVEGLPSGGCVRRDGALVKVPSAHAVKTILFADKPRPAMAIPWGDLSTAFHTTGIPDITVYMATRPRIVRAAKLAWHLRWLLARPSVQALIKRQVARVFRGPDEEQRRTGRVQLWGRVSDPSGRAVEGVGETPEGYTFTAESALACVKRMLDDPRAVEPGARTPAGAFGPELLASLPGCSLRVPRS
jgi:short subunit dehydrogenase-like uncharacterized protein